eukprot:5338873-Amphidinium_carterae.1
MADGRAVSEARFLASFSQGVEACMMSGVQPLTADLAHFEPAAATAHAMASSLQHQLAAQQAVIAQWQ